MKTKLILNSGGIRNNLKLKKKFHQEMIKGLGKDQIKILICSFAQAREYWEEKFLESTGSIQEDLPGIKLKFSLAMPGMFEEQVKKADIIYFNGGDNHILDYWMSSYQLNLFEGKIISGNSASSAYFCDSYWSNDWRSAMRGHDIVHSKMMLHYMANKDIDWMKAEKQLAEFGNPDLPIFKLKEGEYVVFEEDNEGVFKEVRTVYEN